MEFKQLQSFIAVVKYNNFTRAAEKTYISQSTISSHIRQLEEELGVQLFNRTTKSVEITPVGLELYEYSRSIMELKKRMTMACQSGSNQIIHLGASTIPSAYVLPHIMAEFRTHHPNTYFVIHQDDSAGVIEHLKDGVIDVGVIGSDYVDEEVISLPLCSDHIVIITPVNEHYLALKEQKENQIETLLREPIILREEGSGSQKRINSLIQEMNLDEEALNVVARINDQEAIKNLVADGFGITAISERAIREFREEGRVLVFDLPANLASRTLSVIYKRNPELKDYIKEFVQYLRKQVRIENTDSK